MNTTAPDPSRCPLCGGDNRCAMEVASATGQAPAPCWCETESFPADLLDQLPEAARDNACICANCLRAFNQRPATARGAS